MKGRAAPNPKYKLIAGRGKNGLIFVLITIDAMLKVGLTGGIGSGKSSAAKIFETYGIPVYHADERAKQLMASDKEIIAGVKGIFGKDAYGEDGTLNRKFIAQLSFADGLLLKKLEALVHPAVFSDEEQWYASQTVAPYAIMEAALIIESGRNKSYDKIITVTAPLEVRIQRVIDRDKVTRTEVEDRIGRQIPEEEKVLQSDFVIINDGSRSLVMQVWEIHQKLLSFVGAGTP